MIGKIFGVLLFSACFAQAKDTSFSTKEWGQRLQSAVDSGNSVKIKTAAILPRFEDFVHRENSVARSKLEQARILYAKQQYAKAIEVYSQVPKGSDEWLESVEERGWAHFRIGEYDKTLAQTKNLLSPTFREIVGSEPFFLQSLTELKVCDYVSVLETNKLYKETQRERLLSLQNLADTGKIKNLPQLIEKLDRFPMTLADLGDQALLLPRQIHRDMKVQLALMKITLTSKALKILPSSQIISFQRMRDSALRDLQKRVQFLAQRETNENFEMLQKLNIIEVETVQRVHSDQTLDPKSYTRKDFKKADRDQMVFPDDGHPWIDELDKFQVGLNSCPTKVRRKM